ncbi:MAG: hypothetical protein RLN88_04250 [Ekhidna sp.]|uniref:hypothetical protein n=1 Tax=Ekhidna sp. TaxID=2608089 RepID=UPI0032EBC6D8
MEKTITFNSINERKGAEVIIDNAIARTSIRWHSKSCPDDLSIKYENVPDSLFRLVEMHPDWPLIDLVGRSEKLLDIAQGMEKRFDSAPNKVDEAKVIIAEIKQVIDVDI